VKAMRLLGFVLIVFGAFMLSGTVLTSLSSVPYTRTEYWKVDKTVYGATAGITGDYMRAYLCDENWNPVLSELWMPIAAGYSEEQVEGHLVSALSTYPVQQTSSEFEDGDSYYFVFVRQYLREVDGTLVLTTLDADGSEYAGEVDYWVSRRSGHLAIYHASSAWQNPLEVTVSAGTYDVWAVAEGLRSQNATATVVDGGTTRVTLTLRSAEATWHYPDSVPLSFNVVGGAALVAVGCLAWRAGREK